MFAKLKWLAVDEREKPQLRVEKLLLEGQLHEEPQRVKQLHVEEPQQGEEGNFS
jgi:hypothetical protein